MENDSREIILTNRERMLLSQFPEEISREDIIANYNFSSEDLEQIMIRRRDHNKLGFALQLGILRHTGKTFNSFDKIPKIIVTYVSMKLEIDEAVFPMYYDRENTILEHLDEIRKYYGYSNFEDTHIAIIEKLVSTLILKSEDPVYLIRQSMLVLKRDKIIIPRITTLEKMVGKSIIKNDERIFHQIASSISDNQKKQIDELLILEPNERVTTLEWLKESSGSSNSEEFLLTVEKLNKINELQLKLNLKEILYLKIENIIKLGRRYDSFSLRRFSNSKKYSIIALLLVDLKQALIDRSVTIHDIRVNTIFSKVKKSQEKEIQKQKAIIKDTVNDYILLGKTLFNAKKENKDIVKEIEKHISWEKIQKSIINAETIFDKSKTNTFELLDHYYNPMRKYTPTMLNALEFETTNNSCNALIKALDTLKILNESNKNNLPEDIELEFLNKKWQNHIEKKSGTEKRHCFEIAVMNELKNRIRSGDVSVKNSKNFRSFEDYLITKEVWTTEKQTTRLAADLCVDKYLSEQQEKLEELFKWYSKNYDSIKNIVSEDDKIKSQKLGKNTPEEAKTFSLNLYKLIPKINLSDLLIETTEWTGFHQYFVHASTLKPVSNSADLKILMATIIAIGTNVGLYKWADASPNISYSQMANMADWKIYDTNLQNATDAMVNQQLLEPLAKFWGDGTTSSSDGMRVRADVKTLNSGYNPHFGAEKGLTNYRFIADQYSVFYSTVTNPNIRDSSHVLEGLLSHSSNLKIKEHYTDTAGYTDQVFALMQLMGFCFAPRLRNLPDMKLYCIDKNRFPKLKELVTGVINTKLIKENYDDVLRLTHSIYEGKTSSSLILGKIGSYTRGNALANALKEIGRIQKTIFILEYASNPAFRRRIQIGLNKGEEMNGMARAVFFGKRGQFWEHEFKDQLQKASCLNILLNAIVIWNTKYLEKAWLHYKKTNPEANEALLKNISPLNWEHINFYGKYSFENNANFESDKLRALNV